MRREREDFWPNEKNIGRNCYFWNIEKGCTFPIKQMEGRRSCEGIIDDICLWLKDGRLPKSLKSLTPEQLSDLGLRAPAISPLDIPPGDTQA